MTNELDMVMNMNVMPELESLIQPLTKNEYKALEQSILMEGMTEPIVVWSENAAIVDGHNRYRIMDDNRLAIGVSDVVAKDFDTIADVKVWMLRRQLSRRNVTAAQRAAMVLQIKELVKAISIVAASKKPKKGKANGAAKKEAKSGTKKKSKTKSTPATQASSPAPTKDERSTDGQLAKAAGVSRSTIKRMKAVADHSEALAQQVKDGEITLGAATKQMKAEKNAVATSQSEYEGLPNSIADAFGEKSENIEEMRTLLNRVLRIADKTFEDGFEKVLGEGAVKEYRRDAENMKRVLKFLKPKGICPYCNGDGEGRGSKGKRECHPCKGNGWLSAGAWESAPDHLKKKVAPHCIRMIDQSGVRGSAE